MQLEAKDLGEFSSTLESKNLAIPDEFEVIILPRGIVSSSKHEDLLRDDESSTFRKLLSAEGVQVLELLPDGSDVGVLVEKSSDIVLPVLMISFSLLTEDPIRCDFVLEMVVKAIKERLPAVKRRAEEDVELSIVVQQSRKQYKHIEFRGPVEGIREIRKLIKDLDQ